MKKTSSDVEMETVSRSNIDVIALVMRIARTVVMKITVVSRGNAFI